MKILFDTSVLVDHLRGRPEARELLEAAAASDHELWSLAVVRSEVLAELRKGEERATLRLLDSLLWQDVTVAIADRAGEMARKYLRSHPGVDTVDYLLAAAAEVLGAELKTVNVKHFPMLAGLRPAY